VTIEINQHNSKLFWFDLEPNNEKEFITIYILIDDKITLIETGPACSHDNLVEGIEKAGIALSEIDYIVPTHIHLDHFGGGGHIMDVCENANAVVHPNAVYHISNIDKWWLGSLDFLGEVAELYGKPLAIPESRIISAENNFELNLGNTKLKSLHTPGHAPHHITWINGKAAFVGDSLGLWYPKIGKSFPVTPGYYRHDLALQSINLMSDLNLEELYYTHFGPRSSEGAFEQTLSEFQAWMAIIEESIENDLGPKEILDLLFLTQEGLKLTDIKHGIHQRNTHLGSVEGMMSWAMRKNEKN
jgi:glyoxylase-like metal-dependent hydrolase (beta-lactamase superfamily II)